jgi:arylsulfatase A-like enzyme
MYDHRYRPGSPFEQTWHRNLKFVEEEGHATDLVTAEAVRLIEQPRDRPLFLYVPFHSVHTPLVEEQQYLDRVSHIEHADRRLYAAAVCHLDDSIGKLLDALRRTDKLESTLVVFTSDNGAQVHHKGDQYPPPDPKLERFSSNEPLRGRKTEVYEGGIRVPALVYWQGTLAPHVYEAPLHAVDWLPTLARLAGTQAPAEVPLDGIDAWPLITGEVETAPPRTLYWNRNSGDQQRIAVRHGDWKLLRPNADQPWQLYNLARDPYETTNLVAKEPGQVGEMQVLLSVQQAKDARPRTATPPAPP